MWLQTDNKKPALCGFLWQNQNIEITASHLICYLDNNNSDVVAGNRQAVLLKKDVIGDCILGNKHPLMNDSDFTEHVLAFFGADIAEATFSSVCTESGEFVYHGDLKGSPLPVQRFRLFGADPVIGGQIRRHKNFLMLGCAHIVATPDGSRVFVANSSNEPLREVTLAEAIDLLIERRQALGVAA